MAGEKNLVYSAIDKAVFDYNLIEKGDRILIGASGGKDSTLLINYFSDRKKRKEADFEFLALNIESGIGGVLAPEIIELYKKWNAPYESIKIDVIDRLKPGRKMNCYWCSTQRRTELNRYAMEHGFNKIALGHHRDDLLETLLMNMLGAGKLTTMPPRLKYEKYPVEVIRPLCYVAEKDIIEKAKADGYFGWTCTCDYQDNSERKHARRLLEQLTEGDETRKRHMMDSLKNIDPTYLP